MARTKTDTLAACTLANDRGRTLTYWLREHGRRQRYDHSAGDFRPTTDDERRRALEQARLWAISYRNAAITAANIAEEWARQELEKLGLELDERGSDGN